MVNPYTQKNVPQHQNRRLLYGVGINDVEHAVCSNAGEHYEADPAYSRWRSMLARCFDATTKSKHPSYQDTTCAPEWHRLSTFKAWHDAQGDWTACDLDKDLIGGDRNHYRPETCLRLSRELNRSLQMNLGRSASGLPQGVQKQPSGKFIARYRAGPGGKINSPSFATVEEAKAWYVREKRIHMESLAQSHCIRTQAALQTWISQNL